ncbi:MAG: HAD-IA family hydrolase [Oscillospiraceae bacterium]|nr:HAD-IA family hydrolase [Oscillospiraceae bacterium]
MKKAIIWDLDGTLFDSYGVIVESIFLTFQENGIPMSLDEIHRHAINFSIKSLFAGIAGEWDVSAEELHSRYSRISSGKYLQIKPMQNALETLRTLTERGIEHYVFTHRGKTTIPVLENLGMTGFFKEILTSQSGFARKPDPEGILHLLEKHDLDPKHTCYVGDRRIDMLCARNAGISGILFLPEGSIDVSGGAETGIIRDLQEILNII